MPANTFADLTAEDIREYAEKMFSDRGLNQARSNGETVAFGGKGSVTVQLTGRWKGRYTNWEDDERGWVLPEHLRPSTGKKQKAKTEPEPEVDLEEAARRAAAEAEAQRQQAEQLATKLAHLRGEWARSVPIEGTPAERYLSEHRHLMLPAYYGQLRYLDDHQLTPDNGFRCPALLVPFRAEGADDIIGVGAVRLDLNTGSKAPLDVPKPCYHAGKDLGIVAHVQLGDPESATLVLAEGLETGLTRLMAAPCDLRVMWGGLKPVPPQDHTRRVEVIADRDKVQSARQLARFYADKSGIQAYAVVPPRDTGPKGDLNDVMQQYEDTAEALDVLRGVLGEAEHIEPARGSRATRELAIEHGSDVEIAQLLLERLEDLYGPVVCADGHPWYFDGRQFAPLRDSVLTRHIHSADGIMYMTPAGQPAIVKLSHSRVASIENSLLGYRNEPQFFSKERGYPVIPAENGVLVFDPQSGAFEFSGHSRRYRNRHVLAGQYRAEHVDLLRGIEAGSEKAARRFQETLLGTLLYGCFCDDEPADQAAKEQVLQELSGVVMAGWGTRMPRPKAIVAYGPKAQNGKSQWSNLLRCMVPVGAATSVSPTDFGNQYYTYRLGGSLLNACDELPEKAVESDRFKSVVTGEEIQVRQIYRAVTAVAPVAQHWYTTNALPRFRDGVDAGVLRRLMFLLFNRKIPEQEQIADIGRRIAAEEMSLLIAWAAQGLSRFIAQGSEYTVPPSSETTLEEFLHEADPVRAWLAERCIFDPTNTAVRLSAEKAYEDYTEWAQDAGYRDAFKITRATMGKRILRTLPEMPDAGRKIQGKKYYPGLSLRPPAELTDD
jgi:phage/plasmid-associated DNA primase